METTRHGRLREQTAGEVRARLARERISAAEFARLIGWSQPYMARRIDGRVAMDTDDLEVIANALGIKVADLFGGPGTQTTLPKVPLTERPMPTPQETQPQPNSRSPHVVNVASLRPARIRRGPRAPLHPMTASA